MGVHADYGKNVMRSAAGNSYVDWGESVEVDYGAGQPARIDGTVSSLVAVEVESRVAKQVRGALIDLVCHRFPKKLLVLVPVHMWNPRETADQCKYILGKFLSPSDYRVVQLKGTGENPCIEEDGRIVRSALAELGWQVSETSS